MDSNLIASYHYHRANGRFWSPMGDRLPNSAQVALDFAREDVAKGTERYASRGAYAKPPYAPVTPQDNGLAYVADPAAVGLRLVGEVAADTPRGEIWSRRDSCGRLTDPHGDVFKDGTGLCWGVVYQLPGRDGASRFVAGYQMGGCDEGPTLDLRRVYVEPAATYVPTTTDRFGRVTGGYWDWVSDRREMDAARDAARAADSMAQRAAEEERDWQVACQAGSRWADLGEEIAETRKTILAALAERRSVRASETPTLCAMLRDRVESMLDSIREARDAREKLKDGDAPGGFTFYPDDRLRMAFNEGAGGKVI